GKFIEIPLVNQIRPRVKAWREANYPGVSGVTKRLLEHWYNLEGRQNKRFFFCQLEAIETIIWLTEAPPESKAGIDIPSDGSAYPRFCSKMATGSGKTLVMSMLIAWQILNKVIHYQDTRFSKYIFIITPGLTVKKRLQVLLPSNPDNYYQAFNIIPLGLLDKLHQGKILIENWQALNWDTQNIISKRKSVDKRGAKSNEAFAREVLGELARGRNIVIINDEAHHAWRVPPQSKIKGVAKDEIDEATRWIGGCDRIHQARGILSCFDFTATPFTPARKKTKGETLFSWIISDFGLNDAIESGLVKTPRVVIRDDGQLTKEYKSRFYHIYKDAEVKQNLGRKANQEEPLPDLVLNAYNLLGKDWLETAKTWKSAGFTTPPVMITVANRTETSTRIKYAFDSQQIQVNELCVSELTLQVDSKVLNAAEDSEPEITTKSKSGKSDRRSTASSKRKISKKEQGEYLRQIVDTVGKPGKPGERIQQIISVGMLSEGWDAKTVTHIMGLRAFSSQLLCEQVVGRGLRRTAYEIHPETGLLEPEYVNIFGVPFTFLPHESGEDIPPPPPTPKTEIKPVSEKKQAEIKWPNIIRIERIYSSVLKLAISQLEPLELNAIEAATLAELAPIVEGKPDVSKISFIDWKILADSLRLQKIIFETARDIFHRLYPNWKGKKESLLSQLIVIIEDFINSDKIKITPSFLGEDELKRRTIIGLNMTKINRHLLPAFFVENRESSVPIFDSDRPILSTGDMPPWYAGKPCEYTQKSHINCCTLDGAWVGSPAWELDRHPNVDAWMRSDRFGLEIFYMFKGVVRKYRPDFLIKLKNGSFLILETKGRDSDRELIKRNSLDEWVKAVNQYGTFGKWQRAVSRNPTDIAQILERALFSPKF
ncbi:MAG: DEAD/DEAH box helicase family protein, partial [Cyanobacteriota bacterium]|nr:DEAD/DEAH box helicase family protein [Cyanobacteriota bacterium]